MPNRKELEAAYVRLVHMMSLLDHGAVAALCLDNEEERRGYADAISTALPLLERAGVKVDGPTPWRNRSSRLF